MKNGDVNTVDRIDFSMDGMKVDEVVPAELDGAEGLRKSLEKVRDDTERKEPPLSPFLKFKQENLVRYLAAISNIKNTLSDVSARACLMEVNKEEKVVMATMSDGIVAGRVRIECEEVGDGFPEHVVIDCESLVKVSRLAGKFVYLIVDEGIMYVDFFGGRVHLPSYSISVADIKERVAVPKEVKEVEVGMTSFLYCLEMAKAFFASNAAPNLNFCFVQEGNFYLCNGYSVFRFELEVEEEFAIRESDASFLTGMLGASLVGGVKLCIGEGKLVGKSEVVTAILPVVGEKLSNFYTRYFDSFSYAKYYSIDFYKFFSLAFLMSSIYRSSRMMSLISEMGVLYFESKSMDGIVSRVVLSTSRTGETEDFSIEFGLVGILDSLRVFKGFGHLNIAVHENSFCLFNERMKLVVFAKPVIDRVEEIKVATALVEEMRNADKK